MASYQRVIFCGGHIAPGSDFIWSSRRGSCVGRPAPRVSVVARSARACGTSSANRFASNPPAPPPDVTVAWTMSRLARTIGVVTPRAAARVLAVSSNGPHEPAVVDGHRGPRPSRRMRIPAISCSKPPSPAAARGSHPRLADSGRSAARCTFVLSPPRERPNPSRSAPEFLSFARAPLGRALRSHSHIGRRAPACLWAAPHGRVHADRPTLGLTFAVAAQLTQDSGPRSVGGPAPMPVVDGLPVPVPSGRSRHGDPVRVRQNTH
jgi:hypothetical protein